MKKYEVWRGGQVESVEKDWKKFQDVEWSVPIMYVARDVLAGREERGGHSGMKKWVGR